MEFGCFVLNRLKLLLKSVKQFKRIANSKTQVNV